MLLGTATALKIRVQSLLGDIRDFRHLKKKNVEDGTDVVIDVPERFLADIEDPMHEENAANINFDGQLEDFRELMRRNQAEEDDITMRENEGDFLQLQPPEDRSDDFFGAPPPELGETAPATAQGLFDDDNIVPPVDVTAAANNDGATAAAPDAPLRTNGIANPEDAIETPAAEEGEGQAGGRRRPRKRPPPPTFSDSDNETDIEPPNPDAQVQPGAATPTPPPIPDAQPPPEVATPPPNEDQNAPVSEGNEAPVGGHEGGDLDLPSVEQPPERRPKNKRRKRKHYLGGPLIDHVGNLQVNIKSNQETGDETLLEMQEMMPQKQFPSLKLLFATAARKCGRSEISNYYGQRARGEEREGAADDAEPEPADIAMDVDAPLGESDLHDEPHSRLRAGTSADSLAGESGSIQVPDGAVSGIEMSMLNPIEEEACAAEIPVVERSPPQPQEEINVEEAAVVSPPPPPTTTITSDMVEDNDAEMMMMPPPPPPPPAPGAGSVRSEVSDADSLPSGAFDEMGPIESEVMAALVDMGHGGRYVPFDSLVDDFKAKKSVARVFGLLLSMDKRRLIEMKQEEGAGFGGAIGIRKMRG